MERKVDKLDDLMDGALTERFNYELDRVLRNVFDPNTSPKALRSITMKVTIKPTEALDGAMFETEVTSKLAPAMKLSKLAFLQQYDDGRVVATERTNQIPGQQEMDGGEVMPNVVDFGAMKGAKQ